jgi:F-type H+-transporting ATPase subunit gamma
MEAVLANLASAAKDLPGAPKLLAGTGSDQKHLLIVATADKGLCGAFNSSIVRLAREHLAKLQREGKSVKVITVGRKGNDQLKRLYSEQIVWKTDFTAVRTIGFTQAQEIAERVLTMFDAGEFDVATLFYGKFKSVISQVPTAQQIIPAKAPVLRDAPPLHPEEARSVAKGGAPQDEGIRGADLKGATYEYEPDEEGILKALLPRYVAVQIFRALLENVASEQAASMTAMDNATRNAGDMIDKLTLQYNRARQAQITKELIEIISGAEAL